MTTTSTRPAAAAAGSDHFDTRTAATEVAERLTDGLGGGCDLALLFASFHHRAAFAEAATIIAETISTDTLLGCTAESVLSGSKEFEGHAGIAALAMRLPGASIETFSYDQRDPNIDLNNPEEVRELIGLSDEHRATLLLADPYSCSINTLLPVMTGCRDSHPVPIIGGMASGASQPGLNSMLVNDTLNNAGAIGATISGQVEVDFIVSQGCRPIGQPMVVTKADENMIVKLGGVTALEAAQQLATTLGPHERAMLSRGLFVGVAKSEYSQHFGRGDFLIRNVVGTNQKIGGLAIANQIRVGQTVQFHVRDAETADEDLHLLLDAQQLKDNPLAGLLCTCNGRGARLFEQPHHDAAAISERLGAPPLAGFFAAGEIGPIKGQSFLHGHTASLAVFRSQVE